MIIYVVPDSKTKIFHLLPSKYKTVTWKVQKSLKIFLLVPKIWTSGMIERKPFDIEDLAFLCTAFT